MILVELRRIPFIVGVLTEKHLFLWTTGRHCIVITVKRLLRWKARCHLSRFGLILIFPACTRSVAHHPPWFFVLSPQAWLEMCFPLKDSRFLEIHFWSMLSHLQSSSSTGMRMRASCLSHEASGWVTVSYFIWHGSEVCLHTWSPGCSPLWSTGCLLDSTRKMALTRKDRVKDIFS